MDDNKREKYTYTQRRILNFPFNLGKEWKDNCTSKALVGPAKGVPTDYSETFRF